MQIAIDKKLREKINELFEKIAPYLAYDGENFYIVDEAPEGTKEMHEEYLEALRKAYPYK